MKNSLISTPFMVTQAHSDVSIASLVVVRGMICTCTEDL